MKKLNILGAGGHGIVCADLALLCGYRDITFFDDDFDNKKNILSWRIEDSIKWACNNIKKNEDYFIAIGNNTIRHSIFLKLQDSVNIINLVHPNATLSPLSTIGIGNIIYAGAVIKANTTIGNVCIINSISSIGHDCTIKDAVHVCPGSNISGYCNLGERSWLGVGSSTKECITVGAGATIGAGAAVISNVPANETFIGIPARNISKKLC